jgi:glycine/D-amino acid oxidase-like deaminating enzyme
MKVAVIGGGALGLAAAAELVKLGNGDVTVLERKQLASASSGLSVGMIEPQYVDLKSVELRAWSMHAFARLERERGLEITRCGYARVAHAAADLEAFERSVAYQHELGITDAVALDLEGLQRLVPDLDTEGMVGAMFGPSSGFIDGHQLCNIYADLVREGGGTVLTNAAVRGAEERPDGGWRLETAKGTADADVVVNAAGAWAQPVGELFGTKTVVLPQRHQALIAHLPRQLDYMMPMVMDYVPGSGEEGLYFRHETFDTMIAGLHTEDVLHDLVDPDNFRRRGEHKFMSEVAEQLLRRLPGLDGMRLGNAWAGIYPISPDGQPSVGPYGERPSVVAALGAGGSGLQSAPGIGRIVAEWIVHGESRTISAGDRLLPDRPSLHEWASPVQFQAP